MRLGGAALQERTALASKAGAALWLSPGAAPDEEALVALIENAVAPTLRRDAFAVFDRMESSHPDEPHWYLPLIGVEPAWRGRGAGAALMAAALADCDATGAAAYLEATTARSRRLDERLGFEATDVISVANCPPIFPMLRRPNRQAGAGESYKRGMGGRT